MFLDKFMATILHFKPGFTKNCPKVHSNSAPQSSVYTQSCQLQFTILTLSPPPSPLSGSPDIQIVLGPMLLYGAAALSVVGHLPLPLTTWHPQLQQSISNVHFRFLDQGRASGVSLIAFILGFDFLNYSYFRFAPDEGGHRQGKWS